MMARISRSEAGECAIKASMVQILDANDKVHGCGLLVDDQHIVSCSHVVASAAGGTETQNAKPSTLLRIRFPHSTVREVWHAAVSIWHPCIEEAPVDVIEDIVVLQLTRRPPLDAIPGKMALTANWAGRRYLANGFPASNPQGEWVDGVFKGPRLNGWVLLLSHDETDLQIDSGFSGSGVWDEDLGFFAGILAATRTRGEGRKPLSYMLPTSRLQGAWAALPIFSASADPTLPASSWPRPPLIVHRYTLLDMKKGLVGRRQWLSRLREWQGDPKAATVMTLHAIGGSGKSALAWTWFNNAFANNVDVQGGLWYSFYEPGASFGDFLQRLYSYIEGTSAGNNRSNKLGATESQTLFERLGETKLLIVLDGFERLLRAYASDRTTQSTPGGATRNAELTETRARYLCISDDENVNNFLTALDRPLASRILLTSRLVPTAVLNQAGKERQHTSVAALDALDPEDVLEMMDGYGVYGTHSTILRITSRFGHHALLVKLMAAKIANNMAHAGDFDSWFAANPGFEPTSVDVTENRVHVLQYALAQLTTREHQVLIHVAALRGAIAYTDLRELVVGPDAPIPDEEELQAALKTLRNLTLIEWDRGPKRNNFDLHPLVRNTVWLRAQTAEQASVDERLIAEFMAYPDSDDKADPVANERTLSVFIAYIRRHRFDEAWTFSRRLFRDSGKLYEDVPTAIEVAQSFLSKDEWPRLGERAERAECLLHLAKAFELACDSGQALKFFARHRYICGGSTCMLHQAAVHRDRGDLIQNERIIRKVLKVARESSDLWSELIALKLFASSQIGRGIDCSRNLMLRVARLARQMNKYERKKDRRWLLYARQQIATEMARHGDERSRQKAVSLERLDVKIEERSGDVLRLCGAMNSLADTEEMIGEVARAHATARRALELGRRAGMADEVMSAQITMASTALKLGMDADEASRHLIAAAETAERGELRVALSTIKCLQARIAQKQDRLADAARIAAESYRLAWCDGPPFTASRALASAQALLTELGCDLPANLEVTPVPNDFPELVLNPPDQDSDVSADEPTSSWESATPIEAQSLLYVPSGNFGSSEVDRILQRAAKAIESNSLDDALAWSEYATELDPEGHDCWHIRGLACYHAGNLDEALEHHFRAVELALRSNSMELENYRVAKGVVLAALERGTEAVKEFEAARESVDLGGAECTGAWAFALSLDGRREESEQAFRRALEDDPDNGWHQFFFGRSLARSGRTDAAKTAFQLALDATRSPLMPWMVKEAVRNTRSIMH